MRTARSSNLLLVGGGCLPQCMLGYTPSPLGLGLDTPMGVGMDPPSPECGLGHPPPRGMDLDTPFPKPDPPTSPWVWT